MTNEEFQKIVLEELKGLKEEVIGTKEDVGELKGLKEEVIEIKEDVGELKGLKGEVIEIKENVGELKGLKEKVIELKEEIVELKEKTDKMDKKIDAINEQTAWLTEFREEADKNIIKSQEDNRRLKEIVGRHEIEIKSLQEKIG